MKWKLFIKNLTEHFGYAIHKSSGFYEGCSDTGREYADKEDVLPRFILKKAPPTPWSGNDTRFIVDNGKSILEETVYYSHLTLLKLCKHFAFQSVLDMGSHERRITRIFQHIGKEVTTIEIAPGYEADYKEDYLKQKFDKKFDAIWCSQIYEHQRNPGIFLDKIFDDLNNNGVLALTIPFQVDHTVMFGHINITSPLMLIYHLVCAGFDCQEICLKCYNGNIGVILRKKYNGIKRNQAFGSLPLSDATPEKSIRTLGDEFFSKMEESFPPQVRNQVRGHWLSTKTVSINWGDPI
ncbi:MAG: methyltransferase domain-containing protein [Deltaproteobacteria bacterium]|nr:methyltransferase domain-containing protein [Deltaproteobacteria bacterium]